MSLIDAHRRAADAGRRAAELAGARPITVTVRVRTYSAAIGTSGSLLASVVDTELSPRPRVRQLGPGESSFYGGGPGSAPSVSGTRVYEIGPITLTYPGGGYAIADVVPAESPSTRTTYVLNGDDFQDDEEFVLAGPPDASRPHQLTLRVHRAQQGE